ATGSPLPAASRNAVDPTSIGGMSVNLGMAALFVATLVRATTGSAAGEAWPLLARSSLAGPSMVGHVVTSAVGDIVNVPKLVTGSTASWEADFTMLPVVSGAMSASGPVGGGGSAAVSAPRSGSLTASGLTGERGSAFDCNALSFAPAASSLSATSVLADTS